MLLVSRSMAHGPVAPWPAAHEPSLDGRFVVRKCRYMAPGVLGYEQGMLTLQHEYGHDLVCGYGCKTCARGHALHAAAVDHDGH